MSATAPDGAPSSDPVPDRAADRFDPDSVTTFGVDAARWVGDRDLELRYSLDDRFHFVERYHFDVPPELAVPDVDDATLRRATALLHLTASLSYFKAALPPRIDVRSPLEGASVDRLLGALVEHGLAEMRLRAGVGDRGIRPDVRVSGTETPARRAGPGSPGPDARVAPVVVPIGGGKDSLVALDLVRRSGRSPALLAVTTFGDPLASLDLGDRDPIVRVRRTIDPALLELNRAGALNGHVPITAVISSVALVAACLVGASEVVMANERDASIPTVVVDGQEVNHQYSKGWHFERLLADTVEWEVGEVAVFSLLRPVSEAAIFRHFATMPEHLHRISSCNVVRTRGGGSDAGVRWCGECPKCRYSFLGLAAHVPRQQVLEVFGGRDLFDEEEGVDAYLSLLELAGRDRPFECIGEPADARYLMRRCVDRAEWAGTRVARAVDPLLGDVDAPWLGGPNLVPEQYWEALRRLGPGS